MIKLNQDIENLQSLTAVSDVNIYKMKIEKVQSIRGSGYAYA